MHKWKPNKTQRRDFAIKMQDPDFKKTYEERKAKRKEKRLQSSEFDYETAGGFYVPTKIQAEFASLFILSNRLSKEEEEACRMVVSGYGNFEKVHHDYIHVVNELIRNKERLT